jgi:hypothetical protein
MPLFRFHSMGALDDSLKTTVIVKDEKQLYDIILWSIPNEINNIFPFELKICPYPDEKSNFDKRIGWYTHIVTADIGEKKKFVPIGFLSEPFQETT